MMDKLLNITNQLLDLGKRNRLLNFKDSGLKSLKLLNKNIEEIFRHITNGKEFNIFNTDEAFTKYRAELGVTLEQENTLDYEDEKVYEILGKQVQSGEILCYKRGYTLDKTLKSLIKEYRFSLAEKGINALYLSFGFIHYIEEEIEFSAPLLLIPVELDNETGSYVLCEYEDEVLLNPTLKFYFSSVFKTELMDYKHEALSTYFNKIRDILPEGTSLELGSALGIYSFYKMNMYNDLIQNQALVIQNENIRTLLGEVQVEDRSTSNQPIYPVVNFDSSQLDAIQFAADGKSFCLQGPPGSGKSQTITNMIASLLGSGKKVLFVSEKIAALKVVFENLRRAGLSDFAVELHSNKTNKKDFIESLYQTAMLPRYDLDFKSLFVGAKYENLKSNLSSYERALHEKIGNSNTSLLDLFSKYLSIELKPVDIEIHIDGINLYNLERIVASLNEYIIYQSEAGYDYRQSAFYKLNPMEERYILYNFNQDLDISIHHISQLCKIQSMFLTTGVRIDKVKDIYPYVDLLGRLMQIESYHPNYLIKKNREKLIDFIENYLTQSKELDSSALTNYDSSILSENIDLMLSELKQANDSSKLFNKALKESMAKILKYRKSKANAQQIIEELSQLVWFKRSLTIVTNQSNNISKLLGSIKDLNLKTILTDLKSIKFNEDINLSIEDYNNLKSTMEASAIDLKQLTKELVRFSVLTKIYEKPYYTVFDDSIGAVKENLLKLYDERKLIFSYSKLAKAVSNLDSYKALAYLDTYLDHKYEIKEISLQFQKQYYKESIFQIVKEHDVLKEFNSYNESEIIENFIDLDERILKLNRDIIISNNSKYRPDKSIMIEGSEFKLLSKEHEKSRRQMPIRVLLDEIFNLALDIKPVFLMSPLSVSTYLASKPNIFDCVIFDEASQIFSSDALGAIYRAKQCIVIGDTKQMPPTSFFQVGVETDDKEYDLESILDKSSKTFPMTSLKWHYRSRSEELITFSNQSFYQGDLITIPQAKNHSVGFGIDFVYVEDGIYDTSTRTNPIEAARVCDLVFEHFATSNESLGVVAFSNVQAELISDMVEKRLKKLPQYQRFLDPDQDEPFFVKNLESVQGDERDRIIFSICYGYNQDNKFYQRFGPLNNLGGERRLNVAITRAKFNVTVVSSIQPKDIKTDNTSSKGVLLLKEYLQFSQNVVTRKKYEETNNGIILSVEEYVKSLGYVVYPNYGTSSFKIDLAIKKNDEFILAIMIDGKDYSTSLTDKYRLEKLLLERLGWRYFKLFSTAWYNEPELEKQRLFDALENQEIEMTQSKESYQKTYLKEDSEANSFETSFIPYQELHLELAQKYFKSYSLGYLIKELVNREAPIHEDFLIKRVATIMEKNKITSVLKDEIKEAIPLEIIKKDKFYFIDPEMKCGLRINYSREVSHIYSLELQDGLFKIVSSNNGVTQDGCYKTLAQLLCFDKVIPNLRRALDEALQNLILENRMVLKDGCLYTKEIK